MNHRGPKLVISIEKSFGTTATTPAALSTCGNSIIYAAGSGVASLNKDTGAYQFRICAPKQLTADAKTQELNRLLSKDFTQQLGSTNGDAKGLAKYKINPVSCVALASTGYLAIGESGHTPRVVIFNPDNPKIVATMQEHQFGVQLMSFSPGGMSLATLGTPNDGYLYIWQTMPKTKVHLRASNRCISQVTAMIWLSDTVLVTAGVRHLRVWTLGDNAVLPGRNIILGDAASSKFTCLMPLAIDSFLVANSDGQVFKVSGSALELIFELEVAVTSMVTIGDEIAVHGAVKIFYYSKNFELLRQQDLRAASISATSSSLICLQDEGIYDNVTGLLSGPLYTGATPKSESGFVAWKGSTITHFDADGNTNEVEDFEHKITDVKVTTAGKFAIALDNGSVQIGENTFHGHEGDGSPITLDTKGIWTLSAGRDNGLQIYTLGDDGWKLWQTLPFHGRVSRAKIIDADTKTFVVGVGNKLVHMVTADEDGTFHSTKSVTLSALIQDIAVWRNKVYVSTIDKKVTSFDTEGKIVETISTFDILNEPISLSNLSFIEHNDKSLILASGSDKSIVLYDEGILACQWAHSESPSHLFLTGDRKIVSTASDGLFIYNFVETVSSPSSPSTSRSASPTRLLRSPSPTRNVRNPPRSPTAIRPLSSPVRARSPSPVRHTTTSTAPRSPTRSLVKKPSNLRLAEAKTEPQPLDLNAVRDKAPSAGVSLGLEAELKQALSQRTLKPELFPLLTQALEKLDTERAMAFYARKVSEHLNKSQ